MVPAPASSADQRLANTARMEGHNRILPNSSLLDHLKPPGAGLSETQQRVYLALLFTINNDFFAFKDNRHASNAYLHMLMHSADAGPYEDFTLQCVGAKLPSLPMLLAISHHVAETYYAQGNATGGATSAEEVFRFVELTMMTSTGRRDAVLRALWSWVTSPDRAILCCLHTEQLEAMLEEIENLQSRRRASHDEHTPIRDDDDNVDNGPRFLPLYAN
ncbi:hypothetical protein AYL99_04648 [Fonsecaea erecta]|uniref:Uncharacterized protein n=1 Tax=Fonsecaea erecta TaxID=1367422 RepID=A0A178ZTT5_9EURO|nr:hypothetical protein AYL99_04648 [Fonsecaea erecta]OAP62445.1 hypothetical protein AYL99_04648 [Fonsecaea erecta]